MKKPKKNNKIVNYRKYSFLNVGTIMFGLLFIYMVICVVMYFTSTHVTAYEVSAGPLSGNYRYTALSIKTEQIINATQSGAISYYAREGSKIGNGNNICSIDESGQLSEAIKSTEENLNDDLDKAALKEIQNSLSGFAANFDTISYQDVYTFKADVESTMLELTTEQALSNMTETSNGISGLVNLCTAPEEGIVVYSIDGYEEVTPEEIVTKDFDKKTYEKENLRLNATVASGKPIYKLITDENWTLMIPLDKKMATELADQERVKFRFLKDDTVVSAAFSIIQNGSEYFGKIDMKNSLIRYSAERYLDIELILNKESGLKIPNSAIAQKVFYKIPKEYATYEGEQPIEIGLLRETYNKDGSAVTKYVMATVYDATETDFFVDVSLFDEGDYVLKKDSTDRYQVIETESLEGVYNINKGYAIFREITVIDENEEYCIVKAGSSFGLSQHDYIALDASTISDEQIVY